MKRLPLLLVLLLSGIHFFSACKKDHASESNSSKVIGNWRKTFIAIDSNANNTIDASEKTTAAPDDYELLTFASNGIFRDSFNHAGYSSSDSGHYSVNSDWLILNFSVMPYFVFKIYQLDGSTLVLKDTTTSRPNFWISYMKQ